jgi:asparagine synthase (glutamine-hydrolysing)
MGNHSRQPITTFTIRYSDDDQRFEQMPDDSHYARKVATLFGCCHHEFTIHPDIADLLPKMVWHLDEPLSDPAAINTYLISKAAREQGIIVLLNGMGGDEIFGGYRNQLACLLAQRYRACVPGFARRLIRGAVNSLPIATEKRGLRLVRWSRRFVSMASQSGDDQYLLGGMDASKYRALFSWRQTAQREIGEHHHVRSLSHRLNRNGLSYLTRICLADTEVYMPDHNLTYSDKCTMAAGVEGRPPLTDHRIVEFMFSLAPDFRIRRLTQKFLLKQVAEKYLPREVIYRPKAPFGAPLRAWIRGGLSEMIEDLLSVECLNRRGIYDSKFVWQLIENDRAGREDNSHLIWRLLCNEIWVRTFFP